jgi:hypothetical protein
MEEDLRYFAILDNNNKVINAVCVPKNPEPVLSHKWKDTYIWIYDGNLWNSLNEEESKDFDDENENINYVDNIIEDTQEYLNSQFSNAKQNTIVINSENLPEKELVIPNYELSLQSHYESCTIKEFSEDKSITNNRSEIGYTYDEELNAFIPPCDDPTYSLNFESYKWEPDLNVDYDLHGDGVMYRWDGEFWILSNQISE